MGSNLCVVLEQGCFGAFKQGCQRLVSLSSCHDHIYYKVRDLLFSFLIVYLWNSNAQEMSALNRAWYLYDREVSSWTKARLVQHSISRKPAQCRSEIYSDMKVLFRRLCYACFPETAISEHLATSIAKGNPHILLDSLGRIQCRHRQTLDGSKLALVQVISLPDCRVFQSSNWYSGE